MGMNSDVLPSFNLFIRAPTLGFGRVSSVSSGWPRVILFVTLAVPIRMSNLSEEEKAS
jgi:hypothetical protein